jgi:pimeloyl-ACP methyl ester carboxylesterase
MLVDEAVLGPIGDPPGLAITRRPQVGTADGWWGGLEIRRRSADPGGAAVLFLPGRWQNGNLWARGRPSRDLRVVWAEAGIGSMTVRYRTAARQAESDARALAACRTADLIADVEWAAQSMMDTLRPDAVVVVGYSLGAVLACLTLATTDLNLPLAGIVLLDGGIEAPHHRRDARPMPLLLPNPAADQRFLAQAVARLSGAPAPNAALDVLGRALDDDALRYLLASDPWWPSGQIREIQRLVEARRFAGADIDDLLRELDLPALAVATAEGSRDSHRAVRTAELIGRHRARTLWCDGMSHSEVMSHADAPERVFLPVLGWIQTVAVKSFREKAST